jgi:hypothetical protein
MNDEQKLETKLQALGAVAPRLKPDYIRSLEVSETYTRLPSQKVLVCELVLKNGFTVRGESAVVSVENYREEIGQNVSHERAHSKTWEFEGYLLQQRLHEAVDFEAAKLRIKYVLHSDATLSTAQQAALQNVLDFLDLRANPAKLYE